MSLGLDVVHLAPSAVPEAAPIQARAFFDDPAFSFTFPDEARRPLQLGWLMQLGLGYGATYGHVDTTAGQMLGHAVWLPPGETVLAEERMAELGFAQAPQVMGDLGLQRFGAFMELTSGHHERLVPEPHWYLLILGVEPDRQGQGIGSSLIAPTLARADSADLPCYLETSRERNLVFYQRHGFEVLHQEAIADGGPPVWMMRRLRASLRR